jgi:alpha/beta superfamily hydrolase
MDNNAVHAVVRAALDAGMAALTFNFRGVGRSEGTYDGGIGEQDDVRAVLAFAREMEGCERLVLAGYSFGARMAAAVVDASCTALVLVSVPTSGLTERSSSLMAYGGPVLFVSGNGDHLSSAEALTEAATLVQSLARVMVVDGADHFWWGREEDLREAVAGFLLGLPKAS